MKIAMVSEHASPLATLGEEDAGGQNVHVAELSAALVRSGHNVTVYTRRDSRRLPSEVDTEDGYRVVYVPAGPAKKLPKDDLLPQMGAFGSFRIPSTAAVDPSDDGYLAVVDPGGQREWDMWQASHAGSSWTAR